MTIRNAQGSNAYLAGRYIERQARVGEGGQGSVELFGGLGTTENIQPTSVNAVKSARRSSCN